MQWEGFKCTTTNEKLRTYCPNIYTVVLLLLPPKKFAIRPKFGLSSDAPLFSIGFVDWLVCYCKAVIQLARCLMKCRTCGTGEGKGALGPGFSVSFFSALVILLSSHFFVQNDKVFTTTMSFFSQNVVIWWLCNGNLRARGPEPEKKRTKISGPI